MKSPHQPRVGANEEAEHGLGPNAVIAADAEGFMDVAVLVGGAVYLQQAGSLIVMSKDQCAQIIAYLEADEAPLGVVQ